MVDCLTLCNSACITCAWCLLLAFCFPNYYGDFDDADSNKCSFKPRTNRCKKTCRRRSNESKCNYGRPNNCQSKPTTKRREERVLLKCKVSRNHNSCNANQRKYGPCESRHSSNSSNNDKRKLCTRY